MAFFLPGGVCEHRQSCSVYHWLRVTNEAMLNFTRFRKRNKARGVLLKAIGTLVLLFAFLCQHFLVERWKEQLGIVRQLRTETIQLLQNFSEAEMNWLQLQIHSAEATPLSLELALNKLQDAADDVVTGYY